MEAHVEEYNPCARVLSIMARAWAWRIGGPQGSGIDSAARLIGRAASLSGLWAAAEREYHSNIMGKHSYVTLRAGDEPVRAGADHVDVLAAFEPETVVRHVHGGALKPGGVLLHPGGDKPIDQLPFLDAPVRAAASQACLDAGREPSLAGVVAGAEARGHAVRELDFDGMLGAVEEEVGSAPKILKNTLAVGASAAILGIPASCVEDSIALQFAGKSDKLVAMNQVAARVAAKAVEDLAVEPRSGTARDLLWAQGTDVVAVAKVAAGCRFHTYYPISPATDEASFYESHPDCGVVCVQTEDEIAAVTMALGAAVAGARAGTSTSGPGFDLMAEGIGWGGMNEVPLVLIDYQRGGPSTGLPTRTEQADLRFALGLGHGEWPRIVVAPGDLDELWQDTVDAFDWAETWQTPVVILADRKLAGNAASWRRPEVPTTHERGRLVGDEDLDDDEGRHHRFRMDGEATTVRPLPGQRGGIHWLTGDEHDSLGHITEDPEIRDLNQARRLAKLDGFAGSLPGQRAAYLEGPGDADVMLVGWGSTKGSLMEARDRLEARGITASVLMIRILLPFPGDVGPILRSATRLVCVEENGTGQLRDLIAQETGTRCGHFVGKTNGRPIQPGELEEGILHCLDGQPEVMLRHGL